MRLIDADALKLDIVEEGQKSKRYKIGEFWELNRDEIWDVIDRQPTIEPERKKGKWIKVDNGYSYWYECSECGCEPLRSKWNGREVFSDFCPNCGADMREGAEQE